MNPSQETCLGIIGRLRWEVGFFCNYFPSLRGFFFYRRSMQAHFSALLRLTRHLPPSMDGKGLELLPGKSFFSQERLAGLFRVIIS
ncbi:MAG: hypothetical protein GX046_00005 [Tissierellia bacterium]|nr:hypothetical protein [Tissierellia bacterium]